MYLFKTSQMASKELMLLWMITLVRLVESTCPVPDVVCDPGFYHRCPQINPNNTAVCLECPDGTYMPAAAHIQRSCYNCSIITDPENQVSVSDCNSTHDAVIIDCRKCRDKYSTGQSTEQPTTAPAPCGNDTACPNCSSLPSKNQTGQDVYIGLLVGVILLAVLCVFLSVMLLKHKKKLCFKRRTERDMNVYEMSETGTSLMRSEDGRDEPGTGIHDP